MARLMLVWATVRDSLWFIPAVLTSLAVLLAYVVTEVERRSFLDSHWLHSWLFGGGAEGARGVLNAIATGLITVTGVVFSVTIVALQLASSQFTPRVLRTYTSDRGNQVVLGVFIATFTYALLVMRTVSSANDQEDPFVPRLGVTVAVVLVVISVACLIYFIDHSAKSIQIASILDRVTLRTLQDVKRLFPEDLGTADEWSADEEQIVGKECLVESKRAGYLQAVDGQTLFELGRKSKFVIRMEPHIGQFLLPGDALAKVRGNGALSAEVMQHVRSAFVMGYERTPEQDVEFGIIELSDIAVKALSPGINDPTTALRCIDRLCQVLHALGTRRPAAAKRTQSGQVHYIARHTTIDRAMELAFHQIRNYGAGNAVVAAHLIDGLANLATKLSAEGQVVALVNAKAVLDDARRQISGNADRAIIERAAAAYSTDCHLEAFAEQSHG